MNGGPTAGQLLSVRESAARLGVHENTVRNWARDGILVDARVPGSRFRRFREEDVERLVAQRGAAAPSLAAERQVTRLELVGASQLSQWAMSRDAQEHFPELIRRLLVATPGVTNISIRTGDGVALPGWDGTAKSEGTDFLPAGDLLLEFGVSDQSKRKADEDWANRISDVPNDGIFVFATPRRWAGAPKWEAEHRAEGRFRDVKVIDADDIDGWLKATPAAHYWISEHLGLKPRDAETIESWWKRLSRSTEPILRSDLFLAGRLQQAAELRQRVHGSASLTTIQSEWNQDSLGFIHAAHALAEDAVTRPPIVLISSPHVWGRVVEQPGKATLIPLFEHADVAEALKHGHHVITLVDQSITSHRAADIVLARIERHAATEALNKMGLDFTMASRLAARGRRSLPAMVRALSRDPRRTIPDWTRPPVVMIVAPLVLVGSWTTEPGDLEVIDAIVGKPWTEIEPVVRALSLTSDPVFRHVGSHWTVASPEEAFLLVAPHLTELQLDRWSAATERVLLEPDPVLALEPAVRPFAGVQGIKRAHSRSLRTGLAAGAALMAANGTETLINDSGSIATAGERSVKNILRQADAEASGRVWQELTDVLPLLSEAAPQIMLDSIDDDLSRQTPLLLTMFQEPASSSHEILGPSSPHPGLLWAIETVCWSPDYLVDGVRALAKLASIEPEGRSANSPATSMASVLCGWVRHTSAGLDTRVAALDAAIKVDADAGWTLIFALWPSLHGVAFPPASPVFRDWRPPSPGVPIAEYSAFVSILVERALQLAAHSAQRLAHLAEGMPLVPDVDKNRILEMLVKAADDPELTGDDRRLIWVNLRDLTAKHHRFSHAQWAMTREYLQALQKVASTLEPADDPQRHAYLFAWHPDLSGVDDSDWDSYQTALAQQRSTALDEVLDQANGMQLIASMAAAVAAPEQLGWALAAHSSADQAQLLAWLALEPGDVRLAVSTNWARRNLMDHGAGWLRRSLDDPNLTDRGRQTLIRMAPVRSDVLDVLARSEADSHEFWQATLEERVDADVLEIAIAQLIAHERAWRAVFLLANSISSSKRDTDASTDPAGTLATVIEVLDLAIAEDPKPYDLSQMTGHYVGTLLDYLVSTGAPEVDIARLEFATFRLLEYQREPVTLNTVLAQDPATFTELVRLVYRGKSESPGDLSESDRGRATQAWSVLHGWTGFPGRQADGSIDPEVLQTWVTAARLDLSDSDRADIGDEVIGQSFATSPVGEDGVWPCEPVRELIETIGSRDFENGLVLGRINSRGMTTRGVFDGGDQERELAKAYREGSRRMQSQWPRTARILRDLAESYEADALREDTNAELQADHG